MQLRTRRGMMGRVMRMDTVVCGLVMAKYARHGYTRERRGIRSLDWYLLSYARWSWVR